MKINVLLSVMSLCLVSSVAVAQKSPVSNKVESTIVDTLDGAVEISKEMGGKGKRVAKNVSEEASKMRRMVRRKVAESIDAAETAKSKIEHKTTDVYQNIGVMVEKFGKKIQTTAKKISDGPSFYA